MALGGEVVQTTTCGKIIHYQQCMPHHVKIDQTDKYFWRQQITCTKEGVESSDIEIDDFLILALLIFYAKSRCLRS